MRCPVFLGILIILTVAAILLSCLCNRLVQADQQTNSKQHGSRCRSHRSGRNVLEWKRFSTISWALYMRACWEIWGPCAIWHIHIWAIMADHCRKYFELISYSHKKITFLKLEVHILYRLHDDNEAFFVRLFGLAGVANVRCFNNTQACVHVNLSFHR